MKRKSTNSPKKSIREQKRRKNILLVIGMPGSGKSEAAKTVAKLGFKMFTMGDIVRKEVRKRKLRPTAENMKRISLWFHSGGRESLLISRLEHKIAKARTSKPYVVVDGARSPVQLHLMKKNHKVRVLAITLPDRIRWARELVRHRLDVGSLKDLKARDKKELSFGIGKLIQGANFKISNNCPLATFRNRVKKLAKSPYIFKD